MSDPNWNQPGWNQPTNWPPAANVRDLVRGPAIGLIVTGALTVLSSAAGIFTNVLTLITPETRDKIMAGEGGGAAISLLIAGIVFSLAGLASSGVIIYGAVQMLNVRSHKWAMASAIVSMIPLISCCLLGLPIGIWAVVVLGKPEVKAGFEGLDGTTSAPPPPPSYQ
jgi:hypothetical protein